MKTTLCRCNNCYSILVDENPQIGAIEYLIEDSLVLYMDKDADGFWICPVCGTDEYLIDL